MWPRGLLRIILCSLHLLQQAGVLALSLAGVVLGSVLRVLRILLILLILSVVVHRNRHGVRGQMLRVAKGEKNENKKTIKKHTSTCWGAIAPGYPKGCGASCGMWCGATEALGATSMTSLSIPLR
jgi:hypothetical protein